MTVYQVKDDTGKVYRLADSDPIRACQRVADLYGVTIVAWRESRDPKDAIHVWHQ